MEHGVGNTVGHESRQGSNTPWVGGPANLNLLETLRDTAASIRNRRGSCAGGKQEPAGTGRNRQEPAGTGGAGGIGMKFSGFLRILA